MYLEEDGVEEFMVFEGWVYSGNINYDNVSNDPSLVLVKLFCFAQRVGIFELQNAMLDVIRDRATKQHSQSEPLTTSTAIQYAYQNTLTDSPLRKLLADIFAYNVKPDALDEDILSFPVEYLADVLVINMKRLPLRLDEEKADFDVNAKTYHISGLPPSSRAQRVLEETKEKEKEKQRDSVDGLPVEEDSCVHQLATNDDAKSEVIFDQEVDTFGFGTPGFGWSGNSTKSKSKKERAKKSG
ncbi:hypothetical protein MMC17_009533 [Xylographa soralifera]|nr:hypothetical protein [Xylographa soralifera]